MKQLKPYITDETKPGTLPRISSRESFIIIPNHPEQFSRCLSHVVNLANVAVMAHITKIAAVETASAIWEYDPKLLDNRMFGGNLDVIAAIRTLAIKVC